MPDPQATRARLRIERSRVKGPLSTDWWFGIGFRHRHLSVMVMTVTKKQSEEMDRVMHEGLRI